MAYYVYLLASGKHGTLYLGITQDLIRRVYEHKHKLVQGFTSRYHITRLVYFEETTDVQAAMLVRNRSKVGAGKRRMISCERSTRSGKIWERSCSATVGEVPRSARDDYALAQTVYDYPV